MRGEGRTNVCCADGAFKNDRGGREKINVCGADGACEMEGEEWMTNRCSRDSACEKDEGGRGGQMVERGM